MQKLLAVFTIVFLQTIWVSSSSAQVVDDLVELSSTNSAGVPVHPADGDQLYVRWPNGTRGTVTNIGNWFEVTSNSGDVGWITRRYIEVIIDDEVDADPTQEQVAYVVGSWNIEHFKEESTRGFPENTRGGPSYPQSERDMDFIAGIIRDDLQASILVLNEINGVANLKRSNEMDALVEALGDNWDYELSASGDSMRIALLFDDRKVRKGRCHEFSIPFEEEQGKDISARDPIACKFTLRSAAGDRMNDLVVIGVHWASGQRNNTNHNKAMEKLAAGFAGAFDGNPFPDAETDIVIAGDFNANMYDSSDENFWSDFGGSTLDIDTLAPANGEDYPGTRLRGIPLFAGSKIDYVMGSAGLRGDLVLQDAHVHHELLLSPLEDFRRFGSDHIPVTVRVLVKDDDD